MENSARQNEDTSRFHQSAYRTPRRQRLMDVFYSVFVCVDRHLCHQRHHQTHASAPDG